MSPERLEALGEFTGSSRFTNSSWPKAPNAAATELTPIAPLPRILGVSVTFARGETGPRIVEVLEVDGDGLPIDRRA